VKRKKAPATCGLLPGLTMEVAAPVVMPLLGLSCTKIAIPSF
jgi:hypothetical protein